MANKLNYVTDKESPVFYIPPSVSVRDLFALVAFYRGWDGEQVYEVADKILETEVK